jgi:hypothetical protein
MPPRILVFVFASEHFEYQSHLLEIVLAAGTTRGFAGTGKRRQQNCRQDADDRDDDEQLDKGKAFLSHQMMPPWFLKPTPR